jgi:hypothetical protein
MEWRRKKSLSSIGALVEDLNNTVINEKNARRSKETLHKIADLVQQPPVDFIDMGSSVNGLKKSDHLTNESMMSFVACNPLGLLLSMIKTFWHDRELVHSTLVVIYYLFFVLSLVKNNERMASITKDSEDKIIMEQFMDALLSFYNRDGEIVSMVWVACVWQGDFRLRICS